MAMSRDWTDRSRRRVGSQTLLDYRRDINRLQAEVEMLLHRDIAKLQVYLDRLAESLGYR
jgi:hypothetical protein